MTEPTFNLDKIPAMLKELPQWVCWKREFVRGRWTKMPYNPKTGGRAVTTEANTWDTLENTLAAYKRGGYLGIGFVFANNNIIGIDLDHCITDGVLHPDADRIVKTCNSYTEYSVSGDGLHILLLGTKNTAACVRPGMSWGGECAVWESDRFFVMTGRPFGEYPPIPQARQAELNEVCALVWPHQTGPDPKVVQQVRDLKAQGLTVREIAEKVKLSTGCISKYLKPTGTVEADDAAVIDASYACAPAQDAEPREQDAGSREQNIADRVNTDEIPPKSDGGPREQTDVHAVCDDAVHAVGLENDPKQPAVHAVEAGVHAVPDVVHAVAMPIQVRPAQIKPRPVVEMTDEEILDVLPKTLFGKEFEALWTGKWNGEEGRKNGKSEADYHLCRHLAYCTKDAIQIDRLFRKSALMRDKWDVGSPGNTYGEHTIKKVLSRVTAQYRGSLHRAVRKPAAVLPADSNAAKALLERSTAFVTELRTKPDITRLPAAITEYLWQLPDIYLDSIKSQLADCLNGEFKVSSFNRAIQEERTKKKQQAAAMTTAKQADANAPALRNHTVVDGVDDKGNPRKFTYVVPITEIHSALLGHMGNWPRRVDTLLFTDEKGTIRTFDDRDAMFAWVQENMPLYWASGQDSAGQSLVTKAEFVSHLESTTMKYAAVEELPHEPPMADHYYAWRAPENYQATGEYFAKLLSYFDNPETPDDAILIKAALMTPAWGGLPGKRPALIIMAPDRGCGKSTLANIIGHLYGGHIELNLTSTAEDKLTTRLLTPGSMTKRVVRTDNIKFTYNSAFMEGLITAPTISGHRMYHGDASRPNTLTFVLTGNALRLSRDIAERAFIIRLAKPQYRPDWESEVMNFVSEHRSHILVDVIAQLKGAQKSVSISDRYADWVKGVLSRCDGDIDSVIRANQVRRDACDEDQDEAANIMDAIDKELDQNHSQRILNIQQQGETTWDVEPEEWHFFSATEMTEIIRKALNEPLSAKGVNSRLSGHMEAGRLPRITLKRTSACRGYRVQRRTDAVE